MSNVKTISVRDVAKRLGVTPSAAAIALLRSPFRTSIEWHPDKRGRLRQMRVMTHADALQYLAWRKARFSGAAK